MVGEYGPWFLTDTIVSNTNDLKDQNANYLKDQNANYLKDQNANYLSLNILYL